MGIKEDSLGKVIQCLMSYECSVTIHASFVTSLIIPAPSGYDDVDSAELN